MMSATMALVASSRSGSEGIITMGANLRPKCRTLAECAGLSAPNSSTKAPNSSTDSSSRIRTRSNSTVTTASTTSTTALWSAIGLRKRPRTSWGKPHSASATSSGNVRNPSSKKKNNHHGGEIRTRSVASLLFIKTEPLQNLGVSALSTDIVYCNDDDTDTCIIHGHDDDDDDDDDSVVDHLRRVPCLLISPATSCSSNSSCISVSSSKHGSFGNTIHGRCGLTGISDYSVSSASIMSDSCCSAALASSPKSPLSFITSEHPLWASSYTSSITTTYVNSDESDESLSSATRSFDALPLPPPPPSSSRLQTYDDDESCIDEELSCHFLSVGQWGAGSSCDALQDQELMIGPLMEPWRILAPPESDPSRAIREASENRSGIIDSQAVESDAEEEYRIDLSDFIEPKAMDGRPIPADVAGVTTLYRKLGLALDYEDVMASWPSDRGPPILGLHRREEAEEELDLAAWEPENQVMAAAQQSLINLHNVAGKMIEIGEVGRAPVMRMAVERAPECPGPAPEYPVVPLGPAASAASRRARVQRYHEKRRLRLFSKTIRYEVRKLNAERRPRMKGRFIKRTTVE